MTTPAEKLRLVKMYGTITSVDGKWVFKANPMSKCDIRELEHESKWVIVEVVFDNVRGIKVW